MMRMMIVSVLPLLFCSFMTSSKCLNSDYDFVVGLEEDLNADADRKAARPRPSHGRPGAGRGGGDPTTEQKMSMYPDDEEDDEEDEDENVGNHWNKQTIKSYLTLIVMLLPYSCFIQN